MFFPLKSNLLEGQSLFIYKLLTLRPNHLTLFITYLPHTYMFTYECMSTWFLMIVYIHKVCMVQVWLCMPVAACWWRGTRIFIALSLDGTTSRSSFLLDWRDILGYIWQRASRCCTDVDCFFVCVCVCVSYCSHNAEISSTSQAFSVTFTRSLLFSVQV